MAFSNTTLTKTCGKTWAEAAAPVDPEAHGWNIMAIEANAVPISGLEEGSSIRRGFLLFGFKALDTDYGSDNMGAKNERNNYKEQSISDIEPLDFDNNIDEDERDVRFAY